jgi:hypothetical protein
VFEQQPEVATHRSLVPTEIVGQSLNRVEIPCTYPAKQFHSPLGENRLCRFRIEHEEVGESGFGECSGELRSVP